MTHPWPIHPVLLACFPILSLYQVNRQFVAPVDLRSPLAIALATTSATWGLLYLATRDLRRSAQTASILVLLFYGLGLGPILAQYSVDWLSYYWVNTDHHVSAPVVMVCVAISATFLSFRVWRKRYSPRATDVLLNIASATLFILPLGQILAAELTREESGPYRPTPLFRAADATVERRPDIYYVILDGYARSDVLRDLFSFDNEPFLEALEQRGLHVARRGTANYCQTPLSLASSLNARYLGPADAGQVGDREPLHRRIERNAVARTLRDLGYSTVAFDSGFDLTDCRGHVDEYLTPRPRLAAFHDFLIQCTPLHYLRDPLRLGHPYDRARERVEFAWKGLAKLATDPRPTFAFAHLMIPHPPFLYRSDGSPYERPGQPYTLLDGDAFHRDHGDDREYLEGYLCQVRFLNEKLLKMVDAILRESPEPPIILLQSDHGSGLNYATYSLEDTDLRERLGNLMVVGWPGRKPPPGFVDDLSPVNLFRVVLGALFHVDLPKLPDHCYFSDHGDPYRYTDVTSQVRPVGSGVSDSVDQGVGASQRHGTGTHTETSDS